MQSRIALSEHPSQKSHSPSYMEAPPNRGVFRQPRQDNYIKNERAPSSMCRISNFDYPSFDSKAYPQRQQLSKKEITNSQSVAKIFKHVKMFAETVKKAQVQEAQQRKLRAKQNKDYIDLSDIIIDGEIPSKGLFVEKITNYKRLKITNVETAAPKPRDPVLRKELPASRNNRFVRICRGTQTIPVITMDGETQNQSTLRNSTTQYYKEDGGSKFVDSGVQTKRERDGKLTKEEILELLRNTYTTAEIGVGDQRSPPHAHHPSVVHRSSAPPEDQFARKRRQSNRPSTCASPPPSPKESSRFRLSKPASQKGHTNFRDLYNEKTLMMLRLFGDKISSHELLDGVSHEARSEIEPTVTTPCASSQDTDPFSMGRHEAYSSQVVLRQDKSISQLSRIPRIVHSQPSTKK